MKKIFKRAIACLLTVLMIVCSLPFTAFAKQSWEDYTGLNDAGLTDADGNPCAFGFNYLLTGDPADEAYVNVQSGYKPTFALTVQSIGNSKAGDFTTVKNVNNKFYIQNNTYDELDAQGMILDPTNVKKGQRIAVTVELGGLDMLIMAQFKAHFDTTKLSAAYYLGTVWKKYTTGVNANAVKNLAPTRGDDVGALFGGSGSLAADVGPDYGVAVASVYNATDDSSWYIGDFIDSLGVDVGGTYKGKYGVSIATFCFEVLEDCDLTKVFTIDTTSSGISSNFVEPWLEDLMQKYHPDLPDRFSAGHEDEGYPPVVWKWMDAPASTEPTTVDYTYNFADGRPAETVTVNAGETPKAPANSAAVTTHVENSDPSQHVTTTYAWPTFAAETTEYTEVPTTSDPVNCVFDKETIKEATFTEKGIDKFTCPDCGYSYTVETPVKTCDHNWGAWVETKAPSCTETGVETRTCSICKETETRDVAVVPHSWDDGVVTTEPTCTEKGVKTFTCTVCQATKTEDVAETGHKAADAVRENEVAATCIAGGSYDEVVYCSVCKAEISRDAKTTPVDPANHTGNTEVINAKEATCKEAGYTGDTICSDCKVVITPGEEIQKLDHTAAAAVRENVVDPTYEAEGSYDEVVYCSVCAEEISRVSKTIDKLTGGIAITVKAAELGTATVADKNVTTADATAIVAPNSDVVLTATPVEGATFVGWESNGKLVSTDAEMTVKALNAVTYVPVFELSTGEFTVVFTDQYKNVISTQKVSSAADIVIPEGPVIAGYTFTGWSMTAEEIAALTSAATIVAQYEKNADDTFTVTAADGVQITVNGAAVEGTVATDVAYDSFVTVSAEGATAWKVGDATVGYGSTYSFYVGSNITVTPVFDTEVAQVPTVTAVSVAPVVRADGSIDASFLATRTMTDDCTFVNAGFIYGKEATATSELKDVNGTTVKVKYCATTADQFALTYGYSAQSGVINVRAFLAYVDANGDTQVEYATFEPFNYADYVQ